MADATIEVVIQAIDKVSAQLSTISGEITKFSNTNQQATERLSNAWQTSTNKLLAIGNAAATVDRIFSSYENLQLRLENATDRVANAQDRQADSQERVRRTQEDLTNITETYQFVLRNHLEKTAFGQHVMEGYKNAIRDASDAQKEQERASRGLEIAQNNLQRTNNLVAGTFISMGTQIVGLIGSLPELISNFSLLQTVLGGGFVLGLFALGAALKDNKDVQKEVNGLWQDLKGLWTDFKPFVDTTIIPGVQNIIDILHDLITAIDWVIRQWADMLRHFGVLAPLKDLGGVQTQWGPQSIQTQSFPGSPNPFSTKHGGDFILRPNGEMIQTDPRDTLLAMKDFKGGGGGLNINITGNNIYGTNAKDISRALLIELSRKLSI